MDGTGASCRDGSSFGQSKKISAGANFSSGTVGGYVAYLPWGWFLDGKILAAPGNVDYFGALSSTQHRDVTSIGGVAETGYRIGDGTNFIEPGASLSYVNTSIDGMQPFDTRINFEDGNGPRSRIGARVDTTLRTELAKYEPFVKLNALYEFLGRNTTDVFSGDYTLASVDDVTGAIGEVTCGVNVYNVYSLAGDGFSGFAKDNVDFGKDDYVSYGGSLGVRVDW